jgi:superfamily II DNA helicase RecQ
MSKKRSIVTVQLHPEPATELASDEIKALLRGADDLIARGGRTLLSKVLKGSKDKKVLGLRLNESPSYGYFRHLSLNEIVAKIDWLIAHYYLRYEYEGRLPVLMYSPLGWEIEKETYSEELWERFRNLAESGRTDYNAVDLKDRNRELVFLLLEKIRDRGDDRYIPLLRSWEEIEYKKVQQHIRSVIESLKTRTA